MLKLFASLTFFAFAISASHADDCNDGLVDGGNYYRLNQATVSSIVVLGGNVRVNAGKNGGCGHIFYFNKSEKEMLSVILTAKSTGSLVSLYFLADANSPDISIGGTSATHLLGGAEIF